MVSVLAEEYGHHKECLVMLVDKSLITSLVHSLGNIFVSAEKSGSTEICERSVRDRVGIICEAVELSCQLGLFSKDIGNFRTERTVEHDDYDILSLCAQCNNGDLGSSDITDRLIFLIDLHDVHD